MSRRGKIFAGIAAALVVVTIAALWAVNRAAYGLPAFVAWRAVTSEFHGRHHAKVNGIDAYYETYGAGPPVLVLHGAGAALEVMHYFITDLARDHTVIAPDSRAQGRSGDAPGPITYTLMGDDEIKLLDTLHIKQVDVVGWSDGGIIGLDMAMKHPERVRRLVAFGANYRFDGVPASTMSSEAIAEIKKEEQQFYDLIAPDPSHFPIVFAKIVKMIETEPNYTEAELGRIKCPTLIVAGEHDIILRKHTDALARAILGAKEVIVPGAPHEGPLTMPDVYVPMTRAFLDAK